MKVFFKILRKKTVIFNLSSRIIFRNKWSLIISGIFIVLLLCLSYLLIVYGGQDGDAQSAIKIFSTFYIVDLFFRLIFLASIATYLVNMLMMRQMKEGIHREEIRLGVNSAVSFTSRILSIVVFGYVVITINVLMIMIMARITASFQNSDQVFVNSNVIGERCYDYVIYLLFVFVALFFNMLIKPAVSIVLTLLIAFLMAWIPLSYTVALSFENNDRNFMAKELVKYQDAVYIEKGNEFYQKMHASDDTKVFLDDWAGMMQYYQTNKYMSKWGWERTNDDPVSVNRLLASGLYGIDEQDNIFAYPNQTHHRLIYNFIREINGLLDNNASVFQGYSIENSPLFVYMNAKRYENQPSLFNYDGDFQNYTISTIFTKLERLETNQTYRKLMAILADSSRDFERYSIAFSAATSNLIFSYFQAIMLKSDSPSKLVKSSFLNRKVQDGKIVSGIDIANTELWYYVFSIFNLGFNAPTLSIKYIAFDSTSSNNIMFNPFAHFVFLSKGDASFENASLNNLNLTFTDNFQIFYNNNYLSWKPSKSIIEKADSYNKNNLLNWNYRVQSDYSDSNLNIGKKQYASYAGLYAFYFIFYIFLIFLVFFIYRIKVKK